MMYIAIGPACYGRSKVSVDMAVKFAARNWSTLYGGKYEKKKLSIYECADDGAYVNENDGSIMAEPGTAVKQIQKSTLAK